MNFNDSNFDERFRAGDAAAFTEFHEHFRPILFSHILNAIGSVADAEDLTQTTMFRAWQKRHLFNPNSGTLNTWVYRMAENVLVDDYRRNNRIKRGGAIDLQQLDNQDIPDDSADVLDQIEICQEVKAAIKELPQRFRKPVLYRLKGETNLAVAARFGISKGTAATLLNEATSLLRQKKRLRELAGCNPDN